MTPGKRQSQTDSLQNPPQSPFNKGGLKIFPPLKRGVRGDFEIKDISYQNHYVKCNFDFVLWMTPFRIDTVSFYTIIILL
jgi:hypothetical protein